MINFKNFLAAVLLGVCAQAAAVPTLSVDTTPDPALVGAPVDVSVMIGDIADLYAFQFTLSFDPLLLRATGVTEGAFLGSAGASDFDGGAIDNTTGTISFVYGSLFGPVAGASGSGALAFIRFDAIGAGRSSLSFSDLLFLDSAGNDIAVDVAAAGLEVVDAAEVPEPASSLLLLAGLIGAAALRRRQGRATA